MLWFACLHHVLDLILEAAITEKLGPTSGPTETYFTRFKEHFNSMTAAEKSMIAANAASALDLLSVEDETIAGLRAKTKEFMKEFLEKCEKFHRADYLELARLVMVKCS